MSLIRLISQAGPGGILLTLYTIGSGYFWTGALDDRLILYLAVSVGFSIPLLIALASDYALQFIAYPYIADAKMEIDQSTGDEDLYHGHPDKQEHLNDYDEKSFQHTVLVYAGSLIIVGSAIQAYLISTMTAVVAGLSAMVLGALVVYLAFKNLRKAINESPMLYQ